MVCHDISSISVIAPVPNSLPVKYKAHRKLPVTEANNAKLNDIRGKYHSIPRPYFFIDLPIIIPCNIAIHGKNRSKNTELKIQKLFKIKMAKNAAINPVRKDCSKYRSFPVLFESGFMHKVI